MRWLMQEGPDAKKHKEWTHPIITFVIHYSAVLTTTFFAHDILLDAVAQYLPNTHEECSVSSEMIRRRQIVGPFLALYFWLYFCVRLWLKWKSKSDFLYAVFYEQTFMCSVTIAGSAISFCCNRPLVSQAFCIAVGIDQLLWYFDIIGYLSLGSFPIGVCKYLFNPGSNWLSRMASSHHLWTIPLVLWVNGGIFHWLALPLSFVLVPVSVFISHLMTPIAIRTSKEDDEQDLYLNINLSHEMWADVKLRIFLIGKETFPYVVRLVCWWYILNSLTFCILYGISKVILGRSSANIC